MLLVVDIGNTNIVFGFFDNEELRFQCRLKTDTARTVDEYAAIFGSIVRQQFQTLPSLKGSIISSVVPQVTQRIESIITSTFDVQALCVGPGIKTGLALRVPDPATVGADRIVNAVAAKEFYGAPAIVIDFGTATSFDVIDAQSNYLGGIIAPGLEISLDALVKHTAKLPRIELAWPQKVVGNTTVTAMQSGTLLAYTCMIEGLVSRIKSEISEIRTVLATGGLGGVIAPHTKLIDHYDRSLTLRGLQVLAKMNGI